ncbi:hypothetical protein [Acidocella aquatica]|nr:hypothetical protein [Acidocella aquatica]
MELHFASDHPAMAGHFPSNPIVPGALMLDCVVAAVAGGVAGGAAVIRAAKFLHPVRPGERLDLRWQTQVNGAIKFECRLAGGGALALTGTLEISRP